MGSVWGMDAPQIQSVRISPNAFETPDLFENPCFLSRLCGKTCEPGVNGMAFHLESPHPKS